MSLGNKIPLEQETSAEIDIPNNLINKNPKSSLAQAEAAAKLARVYDDIVAMPDGFETVIGEKGVSLSGGQKQRIAASRAMILESDILILDDSLQRLMPRPSMRLLKILKKHGRINQRLSRRIV